MEENKDYIIKGEGESTSDKEIKQVIDIEKKQTKKINNYVRFAILACMLAILIVLAGKLL
jgi:hypothetical protein